MPTTVRRLAAIALTLAAASAACSAAAPQLQERDYLSVAVTENGAPRALVAGTRIRLSFRSGELGVNAGCNSIGGSYRIEGGRLIVDAMGMTEMGCDPDRHAQDEWLAEFLSSRPTVTLVANDLTLQGATTSIRLLDTEVAEPDLNLVGPTWTVEALLTGDAVASAPGDATATFVFLADGTVDVSPGCNRGSGTWKLEGSGIAITDVALTRMACDGPAGELEAFVLQVLSAETLEASIDASVLTLRGPGSGLQLRGA